MLVRYRYRLYPTPGQCVSLARAFGCTRAVFNDYVAARRAAHAAGEKTPSGAAPQKRLITEAKKTPQRSWSGQVSNIVLQQAARDAEAAYRAFFASLKGRRKGARVGAPRFRSRKDARQAIRLRSGGFRIRDNGCLALARIGDVRVAWSRELPSTPSPVTVIKTADGRYYALFVVETDPDGHGEHLPETETELALDLGLSAFATDQHGRTLVRIDRFHPSAKTCSSCGALHDMPLHARTYTCVCGMVMGRDHNAARTILAAGRAERLTACGDQVRLPCGATPAREAGTHRSPV